MTTLALVDLVPLLWKVTLFLAAVASLELVLWRSSASVRHLLWSAALAGALAVPLLSGVLPRWSIPVWADLIPEQGAALFSVDVYSRTPERSEQRPAPGATVAATKPDSQRGGVPWAAIAWALGALVVGLQTLLGAAVVAGLRRKAAPATAAVVSLTDELAEAMGIRQEVRVLTVSGATTPMTWGIRRPVILLPEAVAGGELQRLRAVLLHELAHIARGDFLSHLVAQAACAVYWFHPLVWLARRQALGLRERASDDIVLGFGVQPPDYASSLVELSRALAAPRLCGSLGICRPSTLESRVRAILDSRRRRGRLTPATVGITLSAALMLAAAVGATHPALAEMPRLGMPPVMRIAPPLSAPAPQVAPAPDLAAVESQAAAAAAAYDLEKASSLYRQAAEMKKARFGADSAQYALDLIRLGALYRTWDRLEEAHPFYADALSILERNFGPNYPGLAKPLYFLAMEAQLKDDISGAEALYQRVLDLWEQPASPETALARRGLAAIAQQRGELPRDLQALPEVRFTTLEGAEATAPPASQAYSVGGRVTTPSVLVKVEPQYSREARLVKFQGTVLVQATIQADGSVGDVRVQRSLGLGLDVKAVEAVRQWRFQPGTKDGAPVAVRAQIEINFRLL